jgi:peptide/nickel transport system permease protein
VGVANIPSVARFVRGLVLTTRNELFVEAAHILGIPKWKIMFRHIFPNIISDLIIYSSLMIGGSIMVTSALSYIGLGAQPPSPEWGAMLNYGRGYLRVAWWMSIFPGLAIALVVICVNLLGDALRDALDPKLDPTLQQ